MARTIIVYHRQPFQEVRDASGQSTFKPHTSPNGIVPTLRGYIASLPEPTEALWLAWTQVDSHDSGRLLGEVVLPKNPPLAPSDMRVQRIGLSAELVQAFYHVTSKATLWPILHSFPGRFDYDAAQWAQFREVNQIFADGVCQAADPGAVVWVHDYNLWLVPGLVRAKRPDVTIGFFLHTPFPSADVFGILPWREEIIGSLLACDRIGFHIPRYAENFAACAEAFCRARPHRRQATSRAYAQLGSVLHQPAYTSQLEKNGHITHLDVAPIGIDTGLISRTLRQRSTTEIRDRIRETLGVQKMLLSVGRVDYTKGTCEMLDAYDRLLSRRPELLGQVKLCLTSVAPAAGMNNYADIQNEIEQRVGNINGRYSRLGWTPILLFTTPIAFDELVAWYRAADICWITPLRDGLNLVAKEFVACQKDCDGILVLSDFTGAVIELDQAIHVNPYSTRSMDAAIDQALDMPKQEASLRMQAMVEQVSQHNIKAWTKKMVKLLAG
jgi:glucosylglycerol-phosphate synthase